MSNTDNFIGKKFKNNVGAEFIVIGESHSTKKNKYYFIKFTLSGEVYAVTKQIIFKGNIKDTMYPSVCGIGYIGKQKLSCRTKEYRVWHNMINRCYNEKSTEYKRYGAKGVVVSNRWHCFENFINDLPKIKGYDKELFDKGKLFLDKDKNSNPNKKIYSLETCEFLTSKENNPKYFCYPFVAINPKGSLQFGFNVSDFAKNNNLSAKQIYLAINGYQHTHKGWKFFKIQESVETIENIS